MHDGNNQRVVAHHFINDQIVESTQYDATNFLISAIGFQPRVLPWVDLDLIKRLRQGIGKASAENRVFENHFLNRVSRILECRASDARPFHGF